MIPTHRNILFSI